MKYRLKNSFGSLEKKDYAVVGEPEDLSDAHQLAKDDRYQFQWWALSLVQAKPLGNETGGKEGKKGSDKGIDEVINFIDDKGKAQHVLIQVKSGHVKSGDVRDFHGAIEHREAAIRVYITLEEPTRDMNTEIRLGGLLSFQLVEQGLSTPCRYLTIEDLLNDKAIDMPPYTTAQTLKQSGEGQKERRQAGRVGDINLEAKHHRRSVRLKEYDLGQPGAYFVTLVTHQRAELFGQIVNGNMQLNRRGEIVKEEWFASANIRKEIRLYPEEFVVIPKSYSWDCVDCGCY